MRGHRAGVAWACSIPGPVGITERGVVLGRSVLVRNATGDPRLVLDADRLVALLSVVAERPIGAEVLRPIEAAAAHWRRGEKALANLRLVFSRLPRLTDPAAVARLSLAEQVLDGGMAPDARTMGIRRRRCIGRAARPRWPHCRSGGRDAAATERAALPRAADYRGAGAGRERTRPACRSIDGPARRTGRPCFSRR